MKKPEITIHLRRFCAALRNQESGEKVTVYITLDKTQLQAAQIVGQSSQELIGRFADRNGYELLNIIGKPDKLTVTVPLDELWRRASEEQEERSKWNYLYGGGGIICMGAVSIERYSILEAP
ncbi:MAG: hypothetical protein HFE44_17755 [Oscillospiraceae bacterium]|jgi:hypothetical protein|nr:hypothetical protein [Oscillospiraceae bacterium]